MKYYYTIKRAKRTDSDQWEKRIITTLARSTQLMLHTLNMPYHSLTFVYGLQLYLSLNHTGAKKKKIEHSQLKLNVSSQDKFGQ